MNQPTPAIVAQSAVRRIPRLALLLFCVAYVIPGFIGREGWKNADMAALGFMWQLASGTADWLSPTLLGASPEQPALLPYWLGAWAIQLAPSWVAPDFAARVPFGMLLAVALMASWYGIYYLARSPQAQPVPFAFGGEALPTDYARAIADGGLLAFIACLGLAQLSHEATPALVQLACSALLFYATAAMPYRRIVPSIVGALAMLGLSLSGAPALALIFGLGACALLALHARQKDVEDRAAPWQIATFALATLAAALLAHSLQLWQWKLVPPTADWQTVRGIAELLLWFTWPAGVMALWTLWRWRQHWLTTRQLSLHLALPTWWVAVGLVACIATGASDRTLLLALPALAALAAFALPTFKRQMAAVIDWFTLLFFSFCGLTIWLYWLGMQTGFPPQANANLARLTPGFVSSFSWLALAIALVGTLAWFWLVKWRVGRHRAAVWKSLVLPGAGAAWCWLLLSTLWMPLLNFSQGYEALIKPLRANLDTSQCAQVRLKDQGLTAALLVYGDLQLKSGAEGQDCPWLLTQPNTAGDDDMRVDESQWMPVHTVHHPADRNEAVAIYRRKP